MRKCDSIGLWAIDKPISSCKFATSWCKVCCYNKRDYIQYPNMRACESQLGRDWKNLSGEVVRYEIERKPEKITRFRICTRGEPFADISDFSKVADIARCNPTVTFAVPTRSWVNPAYRRKAEALRSISNIRRLASVDPSHTKEQADDLWARGWSIMFTGDDTVSRGYRCPKTWRKDRAINCKTCAGGCFNKRQTFIHLKVHSVCRKDLSMADLVVS